jgi:hypothetical protein
MERESIKLHAKNNKLEEIMGSKSLSACKSVGDTAGKQKEVDIIGETSLKNLEEGLGDTIKECMVWEIMEKSKETNTFNCGLIGATSLGSDHVEGSNACHILSRKK